MTRILALLLALLCCGHARAATYSCTGTPADVAAINQLTAAVPPGIGGYVHIRTAVSQCDMTGAITVPNDGTVLFGDGPVHLATPDAVGQARETQLRLFPSAQMITANTGPTSSLNADTTALLANPFDLIDMIGNNAYVGYLTTNGNYSNVAATNTPGLTTGGHGVVCENANGTIWSGPNGTGSVVAVGGVTMDHLDSENVGASHYYLTGQDCGVVHSIGQTSWFSALGALKVGGMPAPNGYSVLWDVFTDASRYATYGSSFTYYDMLGLQPSTLNGTVANSSILGGDILRSARTNSTPPQYTANGTTFQDYTNNSSTVPTCYTIGIAGTPQLGQQLTLALSLSRPAGASVQTYPTYTVTSGDIAAADPLRSVMANMAAVVNASPIVVNGVSLQTYAWYAGHATTYTHAFEWRLPGNLACIATATITDSLGVSSPLAYNGGTNGNGSGGGAANNGVSGPYWDVGTYYLSRNYCNVVGGANIYAHVVGNVCDGSSVQGFKIGTGDAAGSPVGGQTAAFYIDNKFVSPNPQCGPAPGCVGNPTINGSYLSVSATCGTVKLQGTPVLGEVITFTQTSPTASNSPQVTHYTVQAVDLPPISSSGIVAVTGQMANAMQSNQLLIAGNPMGAVSQREGTSAGFGQIKFALQVPGVCTESVAYTDSISPAPLTVTNIATGSGTTVLGTGAYNNVGGSQVLPAISPEFTSLANQAGDWPPATQGEQQAELASTFVDSIGVNGSGIAATDGPLLAYTGIKHVRLQAGVTGQTAAQISAYSATIAKVLEMQAYCFCNIPPTGAGSEASWVTTYVDPVTAGVVEAIGGENEVILGPSPDSYNGVGIASGAGAVAYQTALYSAIKSDGNCVPGVFCPTLPTTVLPVATFTLGVGVNSNGFQVGPLADIDDRHCYASNTSSAAATLSYCLLYEVLADTKPGWVTEAGLSTIPTNYTLGVDQTTQARYDLRFLFDAPIQTVARTYLYNLQDYPPVIPASTNFNNYFGLFQNNGTSTVIPKVAATALQNLTTILERNPAGGVLQVPGTLAYTLSGMPSDAYSLLLEQPGGVYDLLLWQDGTSWNPATGQEISLGSHSVTVTLPTAAAVNVYDPITGSNPTQTFSSGASVTVTLGDDPIIVEIE